jgi:hypothetical protein
MRLRYIVASPTGGIRHNPPQPFFFLHFVIVFIFKNWGMNAHSATFITLSIIQSASAQSTFYVMYKMYSPGDSACSGSYDNVYNSDLNEARIDAGDNSISSGKCYKNAMGKFISRACDSSSGTEIISTYSSPGCSASPEYVAMLTVETVGCMFYNNPPLRYMGCTSDENSAISKGYQDVNKKALATLVRKRSQTSTPHDF